MAAVLPAIGAPPSMLPRALPASVLEAERTTSPSDDRPASPTPLLGAVIKPALAPAGDDDHDRWLARREQQQEKMAQRVRARKQAAEDAVLEAAAQEAGAKVRADVLRIARARVQALGTGAGQTARRPHWGEGGRNGHARRSAAVLSVTSRSPKPPIPRRCSKHRSPRAWERPGRRCGTRQAA
jgi:hypothetical protein